MSDGTMTEISDNVKKVWHVTAPWLLIFILFILSIIPHSIPGYFAVKPDLILIAIYYWSIHRPTIVPPSASFVLGLIMDLFSALPLGLNAFIFVLVQKFTSDQRKLFLGQPYFVSWVGFAFVCFISTLIKIGVFYLITRNLPVLDLVWLSMGLTIAIFPIVTILLIASHKIMLRAEGQNA